MTLGSSFLLRFFRMQRFDRDPPASQRILPLHFAPVQSKKTDHIQRMMPPWRSSLPAPKCFDPPTKQIAQQKRWIVIRHPSMTSSRFGKKHCRDCGTSCCNCYSSESLRVSHNCDPPASPTERFLSTRKKRFAHTMTHSLGCETSYCNCCSSASLLASHNSDPPASLDPLNLVP